MPRSAHYDGSVTTDFGPNDWLVDEMYRKYVDDPSSVSESWREFFADYRPRAEVPAPPRPEAELRTQPPKPVVAIPSNERLAASDAAPAETSQTPAPIADATPLRGPAAAIVKNMEASLHV